MLSISICGIGRMGGALAIALENSGIQVDHLIFRENVHADILADAGLSQKLVTLGGLKTIGSDVVIIATGDPDILSAATQLAKLVLSEAVVLHTSGARTAATIEGVFGEDVNVGSMHPLVSISAPRSGAGQFAGAYFCLDGDDAARAAATEIAEALQSRVFSISPEMRPMYHAAAVTASGHLTALFDVAIELFGRCGFSREESQDILLPLVASTVENLRAAAPERALTGPFARGDIETFKKHLDVLKDDALKEDLEIYLKLGLRSVEMILREIGPSPEAQGLEKAISMAKQNVEC